MWALTTRCVAQHSRDLFINKPCCRSTGISLGMNPKPYRQYLTFEQVYRLFSMLLSDYSQINLGDSTMKFSPYTLKKYIFKICRPHSENNISYVKKSQI